MSEETEAKVSKPGELSTSVGREKRVLTRSLRWRIAALCLLVLLLAGILLPPLLRWQQQGEQRVLALSNLRRLSLGLQLYAQDYDSCLMPPVEKLSSGQWLTWPLRTRTYAGPLTIFSSPTNPVPFERSPLSDPVTGCPVNASYALNSRFNNTFHTGPFPLDNLELPAHTLLLTEAGRMSQSPRLSPDGSTPPLALLSYGDMTDRYQGFYPYPATHEGKLAVSAADGHALLIKVEHLSPADGPHNTVLGRIGGDIFNWNGGHPNGELDRPVQE